MSDEEQSHRPSERSEQRNLAAKTDFRSRIKQHLEQVQKKSDSSDFLAKIGPVTQ